MDLVAPPVIVLAMCAALGFLALRTAGASVDIFMNMFTAPELGWPSGVQEDDEFHWHWSRLSAAAEEDVEVPPVRGAEPGAAIVHDSWALPEVVELPDGTGPRGWPVVRL